MLTATIKPDWEHLEWVFGSALNECVVLHDGKQESLREWFSHDGFTVNAHETVLDALSRRMDEIGGVLLSWPVTLH